MHSGGAQQQPALTDFTVEVRRVVGGEKKAVFSYVGNVDPMRIAAVLDHVERLCASLAGEWYVEVTSATPGPLLFRALTHRFTDPRHRGVREQIRFQPASAPPPPRGGGDALEPAVARWFRPLHASPW